MYEANIHALLLILAINKFLLGALVLFLKKRLPRLQGLNYWAYGSFLTAVGLLIYSLTPFPATAIVSFTYSFFLLLFFYTGDVLFINGFRIFFGRKFQKELLLAPLLNIIIAAVFSLLIEATWFRFTLTNLVGFALYLYAAFAIRNLTENIRIRELLRWSSNLYYFYAFIMLVRFVLGLVVRPNDPTNENPLSVFLISAAGITLILLTFSIIVIIITRVNEKLKDEIDNKNRLHSIIAHDMRNSISNIVNNVTILKKSLQLAENQGMNMSVNNISSASVSSRFLLENLFNWSRSQLKEIEAKPVFCNISSVLKNSVEIVKPLAEEKGIDIQFTDDIRADVFCDDSMLGIVFNNLLSNAIKYTPAGGQIMIHLIENQTMVDVSVTDSGAGISEELITRILNGEVKQSKPGTNREKGYGFGLMICLRFLHQNRGILKIDSEPGKGSTFSVSVPKKPVEN